MHYNVLIFLFIFLLAGCNPPATNSDSTDRSRYGEINITDAELAAAVAVINSKCLSCHAGFGLTTNENWIDSGYVVAGDPAGSTLFSAIRGSDVGGAEDMPPSGNLTETEIASIRTWIENIE